MKKKLYNHISPTLSNMEREMLPHIIPGGNWKNIPDHIKSKRLDGIRESGGRTTYYGRLRSNFPSYTITTYFNRLPNGCNIHPTQDRIISIREGARLQSFKDDYKFHSSKTSQYNQIGNAVPPLLGRFIASQLYDQVDNTNFFDLFAGAGGMSEGFHEVGFNPKGANELVKNYFETYINNHPSIHSRDLINGDITDSTIKGSIIDSCLKNKVGVIIGGPPCQGFSLAGFRDKNDTRNQLFRDYFEIVKESNADLFVMENVQGILTMDKGRVIQEILEIFRKESFQVLDPILLSADNYGVPQKRKRVIIMGYKKKRLNFNPKPLFSYEDPDVPDPINVGESILSLPKLGINEGDLEMEYVYDPISSYDLYMNNQIDFDEFYERCFSRKKQKSPHQTKLLF